MSLRGAQVSEPDKAWISPTVGPSFRWGHLKESWRRRGDCLVCVCCVTESDLSGAVISVVIVSISSLSFEPGCNVAFKKSLNFKCPHKKIKYWYLKKKQRYQTCSSRISTERRHIFSWHLNRLMLVCRPLQEYESINVTPQFINLWPMNSCHTEKMLSLYQNMVLTTFSST